MRRRGSAAWPSAISLLSWMSARLGWRILKKAVTCLFGRTAIRANGQDTAEPGRLIRQDGRSICRDKGVPRRFHDYQRQGSERGGKAGLDATGGAFRKRRGAASFGTRRRRGGPARPQDRNRAAPQPTFGMTFWVDSERSAVSSPPACSGEVDDHGRGREDPTPQGARF